MECNGFSFRIAHRKTDIGRLDSNVPLDLIKVIYIFLAKSENYPWASTYIKFIVAYNLYSEGLWSNISV